MRSMLRALLVSVAAVATVLVTACSSDPVGAAQDFADEHFPGELTVIHAQNDVGGPIPFPIIRATYAVVDDPDAVVEVSELREELLTKAVREGRWAAADMREFERVLAAEGFELVGLTAPNRETGRRGNIVVEAELTNDNLPEVTASLDRALADWYAWSSPETPIDRIGIQLIPSVNLEELPRPEDGLPRIVEMTWPARLERLSEGLSFTSSTVAEGDGLRSVRANLVPVLSKDEQAAIGQAVNAEVTDWLAATGGSGTPSSLPYVAWSFLIEGTTSLRTYVHLCPETTPDCTLPQVVEVAGATVDLETLEVTDPEVIEIQRTASGGVAQPLEPALIAELG